MNLSRLAPWLLLAGLLLSGWRYIDGRPQSWRPGVLVPDEPLQQPVEEGVAAARPLRRADFTALPRARLRGTVRVLSTESYRFDALASAVPVDLAVGWGPMSDTSVLESLDISQGARFYTWRHAGAPPLSDREIGLHSANWHMVPANPEVERRLGRVRVGEVLEVEGLLVDLKRDDGGMARTSLRRDDTGAGACEIVWVERLRPVYGR